MKSILIISHWFYPSNNPRSFRARALCDEMRNNGYRVDVLIGSKIQILMDSEIESHYLQSDAANNSSELERENNFSFPKKIFRYLWGEKFIFTHFLKCKKIVSAGNYNSIISIGNPFYVHLIANSLHNQKHKWICDCGDPFYVNSKKHSFIVKMMQKKIFSNVDYITIPINDAINYYNKYANADKIKVIPQGFSMKNVKISKCSANPVPTFAYAGQFYEDLRNPANLLQHLIQLDEKFIFKLYIPQNDRIYREVILPYKKLLGDKLEILEQVPREKCIYELSKCDFLLNIMNANTIQSPSKLIDYCIANRPILSIKPNEVSTAKIQKFLNGDYRDRTEIDINYYDISKVTKQFLDLIEEKSC